MKYKITAVVLIICLLFVTAGCSGSDSEDGITGGYQIYYVNNDQTSLVYQKYNPKSSDTGDLIKEILKQLETSTDSIDYICAKPGSVKLLDYSLEGDTLALSFDDGYLHMEKSTEVLMRMAYVDTLVQISDVANVEFYINEEPLMDSDNQAVGAMNENSFVQNDGSEINEYESTELILYFASEDGKKLVQSTRKVTHSANMSLEKVVIEQLLQGPSSNTDSKSTIPDGTKLLSISTKDSVCYVSFSSEFLNLTSDVSNDVQIYSIVDSLAELSTISKVQISVYGESNASLSSNMELGKILERNLDLVESK